MRRSLALAALAATLGAAGCGPNYSAVADRLRQQTLDQRRQLQDDKTQLANRDATIANLHEQLQGNAPRIATLPQDRLNLLFTVSHIEIRSQTDAWEFQPRQGLTGFRVFLRTLDSDNYILPATGNLTLEAFQLSPPPAEPRRLGTWKFSPEEMKKSWYGGFGLNQFAFNCPWTAPPTDPQILFRATFTDALTGQTLTSELQKKITMPKKTPTQPATAP